MGIRAPTTAPQVVAWAWMSQLFTSVLAVDRSGAMKDVISCDKLRVGANDL